MPRSHSSPPGDDTRVRATEIGLRRRRGFSLNALFDNLFFVVAGVAVVWLAYLVLNEGFASGWAQIWFYLVFWALVAYIALPRLHRILTNIYVPNYFIGRTRTSDGLLGDPVNLGLLGSEEQLHSAMLAAGWTRADDLTLRSGWRIVTSTLLRRSYDEAPVSPLMLFGRNQDFAYQQEVKGNPAKRHHVRFWRCPDGWLLPGGHHTDWLAAGTYDRAVGFSLFTLQITHKIDENTDVERDHIVSTVQEADAAVAVTVLKDFATGYHSRNGGGDAIVTDGDLPVIDLRAVTPSAAAQAMVAAEPTVVPGAGAATASSTTTDTPVRLRRPTPTLFGAVVVLVRAFVPAAIVLAVLLDWDGVKQLLVIEVGSDADELFDRDLVLWVFVAFALVFLVAELLLGIAVLRGSNVARILVMCFSLTNIVIVAVQHIQGEAITLNTSLVGLSLDILILIALSSSRARDYARQPGRRRSRVVTPRAS
ncbi:LssY C-terminal domain-containing protein [Herbiconiux moechotypicola]|uniref:LssY C-terminal domain-containing protein n=1 Tax=Herbiconiux moechotypicola TaxID=637393 RepID=A0ABN3D8I4_9MICO|nr:LssY C-terminal domain-containing protein [Herbiconiux moechotypicola]MCS5728255.1 LssY C-terminal domain-containing protein [Herbiconiux moechotypicola]